MQYLKWLWNKGKVGEKLPRVATLPEKSVCFTKCCGGIRLKCVSSSLHLYGAMDSGEVKSSFFYSFWDSCLDRVFVRMGAVNGLLKFKFFLFSW